MATVKKRPRFPRKGSLAYRRLLFALLWGACLVGGIIYWTYSAEQARIKAEFEQLASTLGQNATATTSRSSKLAVSEKTPPKQAAAKGGASTLAQAALPVEGNSAGGGPPNVPSSARGVGESLWGQPFVGYSLEEIAREIAPKFGGKKAQQWGEHLAGISRQIPGATGKNLALTLDLCTGSYDAALIDFLRVRRIPATLFVTSIWAKAYPRVLKELGEDPLFLIAAHGAKHRPCSVQGKEAYGIKGTESLLELVREVEGNARDLQKATGRRPGWFRSGTAFYDEIAVQVIHDLGLQIAGYAVAVDEGASLSAAQVREKTLGAKAGDILLGHANHPGSGTREGLMEALPALQAKGFTFVLLPQ